MQAKWLTTMDIFAFEVCAAAASLQLKPSEMYMGLVCTVWLLQAIFGSIHRLFCAGVSFKDMHQIFVRLVLFASHRNQ